MDDQAVKSGSSFGQILMEARNSRSLSREELATKVRAVAEAEGDRSGCTARHVRRLELGEVTRPGPALVRWLSTALGIPVEVLASCVGERKAQGPVEPADRDYVETLHATTANLITLEVVHGGCDVVPLALRYVGELRRRLAIASNPPSLDTELRSAGAALIGMAGWMAHDADDREAARLLSYEALHQARLAGDRRVEVLTLSNLALFNLFTGAPAEALTIARSLLPGRLTNYQQVMFQTREARALALMGAGEAAFPIAHDALNQFTNGPAPTTSEWWWLNPQEIRCHVACTYDAAGRWDLALPMWQEIVETPVPTWEGRAWAGLKYLRYVRLLRTALEVGDWQTAESAIDRIVPFVGGVRSGRVETWLGEALKLLKGLEVPSSLRIAEIQLSELYDQC